MNDLNPVLTGATRLAIFSDMHCGHLVGLTPKPWQNQEWATLDKKHAEILAIQSGCWKAFERYVKQFGPFDIIALNGDLIEGPGRKSGGVELLVRDQNQQCKMAVHAIRTAMHSKTKVWMTYGTAGHGGQEEDWEDIIASELKAHIDSTVDLDVEGVVFNFKHHVGSTIVPYGRHTAVARDWMWEMLKGMREHRNGNPAYKWPDIIIRSQTHYFQFSGDQDHLGMTTPALEAPNTKYSRRCHGTTDWGFVIFECKNGEYAWKPVTPRIKALSASTLKA